MWSVDSDTRGLMRPASHTGTATVEFRATPRTTLAGNVVFNDRDMRRENGSTYRDVAVRAAVLAAHVAIVEDDVAGERRARGRPELHGGRAGVRGRPHEAARVRVHRPHAHCLLRRCCP